MAQNISLLGATYNDCPAILLPKSGGGTARFDDASVTTASAADVASGKIFLASDGTITTGTASGGGGGSYAWFGADTTYVGRTFTKTINLKNDTSFDSWTASTTAGDIKAASTTADFTVTGDTSNTYSVIVRAYTEYAYLSGVTLKNIPQRNAMYYGIQIFPYFTDNSSLENNTLNSTTQQNAFTARGGVRYYSSTVGSLGFYANGTYGVYFSGAPSASSSGNVYSFKLSKIQARCNGTYFATARKAYIDSANTNIVVTADVYKTPVPKSIISHYIEELRADMTTGL